MNTQQTPTNYEQERKAFLSILEDEKIAKEALQKSVIHFRSIFENIRDAIYTLSPEGKLLSINQAFETLTGWTVEEWIDKPFTGLVHPEDLPKAIDNFQKVISGEKVKPYELRIRIKSGEYKIGEFTPSPLIVDGKIIAVLGIARDITERKRAEEALRESERRLKEAERLAHIGHWELDLEKNVLNWSDEVYRMFGLQPQEFGATYEAFLERVHPEDRKFVNNAYTDSVQNQTGYNIEHRILLEDSTIKFVNEICKTIYSDVGKPLRSLGAVIDITERKRAEESLRKSEKQFRNLFENAPIGIGIADLQGNLLAFNDAMLIPGQYTRADIEQIGNVAALYYEPQDRNEVMALLQQQGFVMGCEARFKRKDGSPYHTLLSLTRTVFNGQPALQAIVEDITERKRAEERHKSLSNILEESLNEIYVFDTTTLKFIEVNRGARANIGYSIDELRKMTPLDLKPEFTPQSFNELVSPLRTGERELIVFNTIHRRKNGSNYQVEVYLQYSTYESKTVFIAIILDITERKQTEEKIQLQNQRLEVLREIDTAILSADSIKDIVGAALDHIRELIDCRRAHLTLFDWETDEALVFEMRMTGETSVPSGQRFPLESHRHNIKILSQNQPALMNDLSAWKDPPPMVQSLMMDGLLSVCLLPIFSQQKLTGCLSLLSEIPGFFDEDKINLGHEVANQVAIALTQNRLVESLRESEEKFRQLAENIHQVFWMTDPQKNQMLYISPAY
ncbi:MAG: PAS domain S-box protein [Bacteroidota bacterium]|nr:PAS domain S-box protein [Bacteroidota bacterium]